MSTISTISTTTSLFKIGISFAMIFLFSGIYMMFDYSYWTGLNEFNDSGIQKYLNRLYFSTTAWSTMGFGDITPASSITKFLVIIQAFLLISITFLW